MNFLGFGQSAEVDILFDGAENRKLAEIKTEDGKKEKYLLYYDGETVSGKVNVTLKKPGSKLEHQGIKIELIGQIELLYDRGNHHEFTSLPKELARPGDLIQNTSYPFEFPNVEKPFEVYVGSNVRLRYFLRATIVRRLSDIVREVDIAVHTLCSYPDLNNPIKMEVGIEDCLHIEFEYNKSRYHLNDVIVGKIYFLLVRIKIKHMEIAIIKRESGSGPNTYMENDTIAKYEIMDGAPVKGESIPIRVFLAGYELTPTMRDINKKFSVKYYLNLVLIDTEDRRYFKQQEITLWRKADKPRRNQSAHHPANNPHVPTHLVGGPESDLSTNRSLSALIGNTTSSCNKEGSQPLSFSCNSRTGTNVVEKLMPSALSSTHDEGNIITISDPKMGLFTRESPNQEMNPISIDILNSSKTVNTPSSSLSSLPLLINDSNTNNENATAAHMQRGTADGAASTNNTKPKNGQATNEEPTQNTGVSGALFDKNTPSVAITPPLLPLNKENQVSLEIETNTSNAVSEVAITTKNMPKVSKTFVQNKEEPSQIQALQISKERKTIPIKFSGNE